MNRDPMIHVLNSLVWAALSASLLFDIGGPATKPWTYPIGWVLAGFALSRMGQAFSIWWYTTDNNAARGLDQ